MPRQTFATREFFVETCEAAAREAVIALPYFFNRLRFMAENEKLFCITFLYEPQVQQQPVHIAISLLPLNESHTKITVHGSYTNGSAFSKDPYITTAVANVEAALRCAISGDNAPFEPIVPKKKIAQRCLHVKHATAGMLNNAFKGRKFFRPSHS